MNEKFHCTCRFTECNDFSMTERQKVGTEFWNLGDFDKQNSFIVRNITVTKKKRAISDESVDYPKVVFLHISDILVCGSVFREIFKQNLRFS